ncbi:MAG: vitamin K epoxide reductase family protein [Armatimonadota bacterium]|nr:vitamin K epoxide reductase family protein [Armatimonadota bacterium]
MKDAPAVVSDRPTEIPPTDVPENRVRLSWPHLILGVIGSMVSLYALIIHNRIKAGGESGCGFTETINCDKVLTSDWGVFLHIPLGAWGMAFFFIVILTAITTAPPTTSARRIAAPRLLVATLGLAACGVLSYISLAIIGAACPICIATYVTTFLLFLVSLYEYAKAR